ncbi:MAG: radical SAM family heme chaperone HemW [Planctomycetota bacterium]
MAISALYVHVPFCVRKCRYCDFPSRAYEPGLAAAYLAALSEEIEAVAGRVRPTTLYLGGGTPTALPVAQLTALLAILGRLDTGGLEEWTVEANPGTISTEKLMQLREHGATRLSVGVQTFDPAGLRVLGRAHTAKQARAVAGFCRETGFDNFSLDLISGWPGQTLAGWERDLAAAVALEPAHLSCYGLTYEPGAPLHGARERGEVTPVGEALERALFDRMGAVLEERGYLRYEISSFARPGQVCRHNLAYWTGEEYLGLGPGAHSYVGGVRFCNAASVPEYIQRVTDSGGARVWEERLGPERAAREQLVIGLRLRRGVDPDAFCSRTGYAIPDLLGETLPPLVEGGWLEWLDGSLRLSERALPVADTILADLVA